MVLSSFTLVRTLSGLIWALPCLSSTSPVHLYGPVGPHSIKIFLAKLLSVAHLFVFGDFINRTHWCFHIVHHLSLFCSCSSWAVTDNALLYVFIQPTTMCSLLCVWCPFCCPLQGYFFGMVSLRHKTNIHCWGSRSHDAMRPNENKENKGKGFYTYPFTATFKAKENKGDGLGWTKKGSQNIRIV